MFCDGVSRRLKGLLLNISKHQFASKSTKFCPRCQSTKCITQFSKHTINGHQCYCKSCNSQYKLDYTETLEGWLRKLSLNASHRHKGLFNLSPGYLLDLWYTQKGLCYLTDYPMCHSANSNWKCSLERLDNNLGYEKGNVALICQEFNTRMQWTHDLIQQLPLKINKLADENELSDIFADLYKMDDGRKSGKKCIQCNLVTPSGSNLFCEGCMSQNEKMTEYWKFIRYTLGIAKSNSSSRRKKCSKRGEFTLTCSWTNEILKRQRYRCYYFNIPMEFAKGSPWTLSPERLDSSLGYTPENTRFICQIFQSCANTSPKYNITGSPQWTRVKVNEFLMHKYGISLDYSTMFT